MRYKVIVNPKAGRGFGARAVPRIEANLSAHGLDYDLVQTNWPGEATEIARRSIMDGYDTVIAAGGDGTYQEVINGLLASAPKDAADGHVVGTLGVLPVGSGCDFGWGIGMPGDLDEACDRLAGGETRVVDVVRLTVDGETRYFDNTLGLGFEGVVTLEVRKVKYLRGMALYLPVVIKSIFLTLQPARATIELERDGQTDRLEGRFLMIDVCNGGRAGGAFFISPDAQPDDGLLDVCIVEDVSRMRMLALVPRFLNGTHVNQPDVQMYRAERVRISSPDSLSGHADGELVCTDGHNIECQVVPKRLRVIC